jgi:KAP family P-loop domain
MKNFDDKPIATPTEDQFGFDPFARAIANTISNLKRPEGSVFSINGPWGSGKSSIVNLVKHHLKETTDDNELKIIEFNCWWFRGEEALALEFFRDLYSAMDMANSEKAKDAVSQLGSRLLSGSSSFVGAAINFFAAPGVGEIASGGMNFLSDLIRQEKTVESFHKDVSQGLRESNKRFLIVIDDIDRLAPDEALLIFRLVKSVGRLPNVMYLMAYDRAIAERVVSDRYPSEGAQYLEKIVQAGFDIPNPPQSKLINSLNVFLDSLWAELQPPDIQHFWNRMHDVISPVIHSPRDILRIANTLSVTWKAVNGEVDPVDFLCIETLRVQRPALYAALRSNKSRLVDGGLDNSYTEKQSVVNLYDEIFLSGLSGEEKENVKKSLRRLFPSLDGVWGNTSYSYDFYQQWSERRLVCSMQHFDTYFRFSLSDDNISLREVNAVIENCDDEDFVRNALLQAKEISNGEGGTRAALLLDELNIRAKRISLDKATIFLSALFSIHDEIDIAADQSRGFSVANNSLRIHWILRSITRDRTTLIERSKIITDAAVEASVGWLVSLAESAYHDYHPRSGNQPEPEDGCITTESDALKLRELALKKIEATAKDGTLLSYEGLVSVLYRWDKFAETGTNEKGRAWCSEQLDNEAAIERFADAFVSSSWSHGMGGFGSLGDTVAIRKDHVSKKNLARFLEVHDFKSRVEALMSKSDPSSLRHAKLKRLIDAWDTDHHDF